MPNNEIEYSIVIPVYNSEKSLKELYERITKVLEKITPKYEIILVDDDSVDNSWKILKELRKNDKRVKIIQHMRNFGQHYALLCGFRNSKGNYIITMDDDLQHPPEEIPKLIREMKDNDYFDVIMGHPEKKKHKFHRNLVSGIANRINSYFFNKPKDLRMTSFRIMKRVVVKKLNNFKNPNFVLAPALLKITRRMKNIEVNHEPRKYGKSQYSSNKIMRMGLDNILNNSNIPLRLVSIFGVIIALLSFGYGFYVIYKFLFIGITVPGWTSTILALLFLSGVILISMGIIGEYLIRIIKATKQNFQYIVREKEI